MAKQTKGLLKKLLLPIIVIAVVVGAVFLFQASESGQRFLGMAGDEKVAKMEFTITNGFEDVIFVEGFDIKCECDPEKVVWNITVEGGRRREGTGGIKSIEEGMMVPIAQSLKPYQNIRINVTDKGAVYDLNPHSIEFEHKGDLYKAVFPGVGDKEKPLAEITLGPREDIYKKILENGYR